MPLTGTGDNAYMGSRERTSYCMPCDRVVVWKTWRVWQKHLGSAEHRECLVSPRPLPPDRLRPADLDDGAYGLAEGESVVFRRPDGLWIGLAALDGGATLRIAASQRQIAIERLRRHLLDEAPATKQLCLRCRLLLDPVVLGNHNTSKLHRSNKEPNLEAEVAPARPEQPLTASAPESDRGLQLSMEPITLTIADAARVIGLSKSTISELARQGTIPSLRVGSRVLVPVKALQEWVEGRLREDADRYAASWARVRDYARFESAPTRPRGNRGSWRS